MNRLGPAALAAAAFAVAGCGSLIPAYERPAAPVAAAFPDAPAATPGQKAAPDIDWAEFFSAEPRLQRLIALALDHNRDLRIAVLNIERARAQLGAARADAWPTVGMGAGASRQTKTEGGINSTYTAGLSVTAWELDLFGRIRSLGDAAQARLLAGEEARKAAQIALVAAVATAHYALQADDELLALTRRTLTTREDSLKLVRLKFDHGAAAAPELRQAESLLESARVAFAQQTRQRAQGENALVLLLGQAPPADLPAAAALEATTLPDLPAGLPSEVLVRRPDVRQAEQQLIAANATIGAARAALFPRITLTASLGAASPSLAGLFDDGNLAWSFVPQVLLPIFDAGRNRANLDVANVDREIALAGYERAIQAAFREVADALAGRATLAEQLRAQQALALAEDDRARLAEMRWRGGVASHLELYDAQRSAFAAQQALVQLRAAQAQNALLLYRVLGGGWREPPK